MSYQILINGQPLQPTHGEPYIFKTLQEVKDTIEMCYGLESLKTFVKVIETNKSK
jgi:hypothetical protein